MIKIREKLNHITILYVPVVESVKLIVQEHYDTPEYENCIVCVNVLPDINDNERDLLKGYSKRIYYMLEHKIPDYDYYNKHFCVWDNDVIWQIGYFGIDEMWTMDWCPQFALRCVEQHNIQIKYKPVRYTTLIKKDNSCKTPIKTVDCCIVGVISNDIANYRYNVIKEIENKHLFSLKIITQCYNMESVTQELDTSKFILDIPREDFIITQNQVRIFELLCMGYTVISKKCDINLFPDLVYEYETVDDINKIVQLGEYLHPTEAYKEMTYTDEAYENYVNNLIRLQDGV